MTGSILRGVVVHEVSKIKARNIAEATTEDPVSNSWQREAVKNLLCQTAVDPASVPPFTSTLTPPPTPGRTPDLTPPLTVRAGVVVNPPSDPGPTPAPSPAPTSNSKRGYVTGERHLAGVPELGNPPSPRCPNHATAPSPPACGACADARRARGDWDIAEAAAKAAAIDECTICGEYGYRLGDDGLAADTAIRCTLQPVIEAAHA